MEPIKKVNVREEAFKSILNMIMENKMAPGDKLPSEDDLKNALGVSKHSIRDALNNLNMLGIIETKHGDGNYIKSFGVGLYMNMLIPYLVINNTNMVTVLQFRQGIEVVSARYAALNATEEDIRELEEKNTLRKKYLGDYDNYIDADMDFHFAITKASKNEMLLQCMTVIKNYCHEALAHYIPEKYASNIDFHDKIVDAIKAGDKNLSANYMNEHMEAIIETFNENLEKESK